MADDIDRAAARSEELLADALAAHARKVRKHQAPHAAEDCSDCGGDIPQARRVAVPNALRCVGCQTVYETRGKF